MDSLVLLVRTEAQRDDVFAGSVTLNTVRIVRSFNRRHRQPT